MDARYALAFVARRQGEVAMDASQWRHVMSLELGWMAPGDAAKYVAACQQAGLLVPDEGILRLSFDPKAIEVPRGFRPDLTKMPTAQSRGVEGQAGSGPGHAAEMSARPGLTAPAADASRPLAGGGRPAAGASQAAADARDPADGFSHWLVRVAKQRKEAVGATMAAVEAAQDGTGGLLHAEAALLLLGAEAGLDVKAAAASALTRLRA